MSRPPVPPPIPVDPADIVATLDVAPAQAAAQVAPSERPRPVRVSLLLKRMLATY